MDGANFYICWIIISCLVVLLCSGIPYSEKEPDEQRLYNQIMRSYTNTVRPALNDSKPLQVLFSMRLNQIVSLNERQQVLTTNAFIDQSWTDPALAWDPVEFKDVRSLRVPADQIWKPDTFIYNNVNNGSTGFIHGTYIQIRHTGEVTWPVPVRLRSSCIVKIAYFPFDYQFCMVKFGSWIYSYALVDYAVREDVVSVDLTTYIKNSEWELISMKLEKSVANRSRGVGLHPYLTAVLHLKRNTFYYIFNIIVPCVMLSVLTLMTFWLPPTSGEKVTLGLSVFLAFSMFMLLIAEEVPASSDAVPVIGIYLCVVMTMTSLSVICAVLVTNLHSRGSKLRPAPRWLANMFIRYLAVPFCVSQDILLLANTIHLSDYCQFFILHENRCTKILEMHDQSTDNQSSTATREDTEDQASSTSTDREYINIHQAELLQSPANCSHTRLNSESPQVKHQHHPLHRPDEKLLRKQVGEEDIALEIYNQTAASSLLDTRQQACSGQYAQYKSVGTSEEDFISIENSGNSEFRETALDATIAKIIPENNRPTTSAVATSEFFSYTDKFNHLYSITPCKKHETFCECSDNDSDVWVRRDDVTSPTNETTSPQCGSQGESDSEAEILQVLLPKPPQANPSMIPTCSSSSNSKQKRCHIRQRIRKSSRLFENPKLVIKRARIMIAEWCTIAKVVDRILFTLSLLATIFAYVIILIVVPSGNKVMAENKTFVSPMGHL